MTVRNAFENCLIELNKVLAPSLLVDDFIYMFNKAVQQYVNKRYNIFETKQQLTDDLRVLTKTVKISFKENDSETTKEESDILYLEEELDGVFGKSYRCPLPSDYVHMLNCICEFKNDENHRCFNKNELYFHQGANKLDTSQWPHVIGNYYMKPSAKRPYYYIINITDPKSMSYISDDEKKKIEKSDNDTTIPDNRYGNSVLPTMLIKCGDGKLNAVYIDYLRAPKYLILDQDLLDDITDQSQIIEFPDYVIYEIINEIVKLVMENSLNPRIQTNSNVNQTII